MPAVVDENPHLSHLLSRSDSVRSSESSSVDKRVSFNNDVRIKRIPQNQIKTSCSETKVVHQAIDPEKVESETQLLLKQLEGIECSVSTSEQGSKDNRLYGLHALNNLDIAVNGKEVNSMPSYQEIRRNSIAHSEQKLETPPKPPRKNMTHYAQPAVSGLHSDLESISSEAKYHRRKTLMQQQAEALNNDDSAIASGGDADDSTVTSSYTSRFQRRPSPQRREKMSPSRSCMTDSEILRSPTEVLYAVSEKHKIRGANINSEVGHQTLEHQRPPPPQARSYVTRPRSSYTYSSREDLASNDEVYTRRSTSENHRYKPKSYANYHNSRSLDRLQHHPDDYEANKENTFKTRIQVISPDRQHMIQNGTAAGGQNRKPYKTTINTATDNILYRGNSSDNLSYYHYGENGSHYKIPKSNRPIATKNMNAYEHHNGSPYRNTLQRPPTSQQFQSTRLIRNLESNNRGRTYVDRERGMMIRNRNYSGHSTSPDRDGSPERGYMNRHPRAPPRGSYMHQRSPSSSPTRPPRSRSSPTRESSTMVRRTNSRRDQVDRSPSVMTNGLRDRSRESNSRMSYVSPSGNHHEDRLSKFIEYRGEDIMMPHAQDPNQQVRRATLTERERGQSLPPGATIENMRDFYKSNQYKSMHQLPPSPTRPAPVLERGHRTSSRMSPSAGPRVSISEGDVTDEGSRAVAAPPPEKMPRHHRRPVSTSGLRSLSSGKRQAPSPPVAPSTGKGLVVRRVVSSDGRTSANSRPIQSNVVQKAPSMRRIVVGNRRSSVDNGLDSSFSESEGFNAETDQPRPWSSLSDDDLEDEIEYVLAVTNGIVNGQHNEDVDRPLSGIMSTVSAASSRPSTTATIVHVHSQPPVKIMPTVHRDPSIKRVPASSVVFHENPTAYHTIIKDKQPLGDFGRRWTAATSDIDSDYRRELATNGTGLHQEARSRDGGLSWAGGRLSRGSSKTNIRSVDEPDIILRSPSTTDLERSNSNSAREEERRKVLEIEGVINRNQQVAPPQLRANVSRSASRASRTAHVTNAGPRGYKPPRHLSAGAELDRESQYSGHSSSQTVPLPGPNGSSKLNRFDQHRVGVGRVRRSTSNATNVAAIGGVRREINQRKTKLPGGSLTSSVNSSESEQGSHAGQSAISRNTARSNRSVYLHAAAVADIPSPGPETIRMAPNRSQSAESRAETSVTQPPPVRQASNAGPPPTTNSNLKNSKKISRSISLLAPWKPRPVQDKFEIHYDNGNLYANPATRVTVEPGNMPPAPAPAPAPANSNKPPRPPTAPPPPPTAVIRRHPSSRVDTSRSASNLLLNQSNRPDDDEDTTPAVILAERKIENGKKSTKVSRSVSMPKDSRLAGWFKKRKRLA